MLSISPSSTAAGATLFLALFVWIRWSSRSGPSLPPGPKPFPLLGNLTDFLEVALWLPATRWAKQYGDVVYLHVFGQSIIFLSSPEAAFDLFDKRGSIYSDRPWRLMTNELCGCKNLLVFTAYGERLKRQRKILHRAFGPQSIPSYHPLIARETQGFLSRLLGSPENYQQHTRRYAGGLALSAVYGYEPAPKNDELLALAQEAIDLITNEITSGSGVWPVDIIPALQYLPAWFPGAGFKAKAAKWKAKIEEPADKPYEFVKRSMDSGRYQQSLCSNLIENTENITEQFESDLKWTASSIYFASVDTTLATTSHFLLAMMAHPEVLAKAQKEIDSVVGTERLPSFSDRTSLPYVEAVLSETWRWGVPGPIGVPHCSMEDDIYRGMRIPKGSIIISNIWAIFRDESIYPDASTFSPDRFLAEDIDPETRKRREPRNYVFGFGRRICPGMHLVESSIWILLVSMMATLDISKAVDENGNIVEPEIVFNNPVFRTPDVFKCCIKPRSEQARKLIVAAEM